MNLQRLEILEAVIRCEFNVSRAAVELRQSQPGVSKQLQVLEEELGFPLFKRSGRRLIGLTDPGLEAHRIAQRMLRDRDALRDITSDFHRTEQGTLTIATTHTQARYALPQAVKTFMSDSHAFNWHCTKAARPRCASRQPTGKRIWPSPRRPSAKTRGWWSCPATNGIAP